MARITKRVVEAAEPRAKEYFIWDEDLAGFGLRVLPSGRKAYVVQFRAGRRVRRMALSAANVLTPEQARTKAMAIIVDVKHGGDPAAERNADRKALLVDELAKRFDDEHIAVRLKLSTAKEYRRNLKRFILPLIGRMKITEVTRADIAKLHYDLQHVPYQANRCLEVVSKMFNLAEMWGYRTDGSNPRRHIKKYPEKRRERFLSHAELKKLGEVIREIEDEDVEMSSAVNALKLLVLTGCRLGEILNLKWEHVDLERRAFYLPDSKTGAKTVHIGQTVVDAFAGIERVEDNPWVIAGKLPGARLTDLQPFWQRVRARAGIKDVRIHDLRHSFASVAIGINENLPMIGKLLGHTQVQTTARYAHIAASPIKESASRVSSEIASLMAA